MWKDRGRITNPRTLVRAGSGVLAGLVLALLMAACGKGDGGSPTGPTGAPTLTSIAPDSGGVGKTAKTVSVALLGSGFDEANLEVKVSGSGVEAVIDSIRSPTYLTADFIIAGGTPLGERAVTVTSDAGTSASVTFTLARVRHLIKLVDDDVVPANLVVEAGDEVTWLNTGDHDHTVSVYGDFEWEDRLLAPGESFSHIFETPGDYAFICIFPPNEVSNVTVQ